MRCQMRRVRSRQPGQRLSHTRAGSPGAAHYSCTFRPRLELLEDRVQPGATILVLSVVALLGLRFSYCDSPLALDPDALDREWHHGLFSSLEAAGSLVPEGAGRDDAAHVTIGDRAINVATDGRTDGFSLPGPLNADVLNGHMAAYRLAGPPLPESHALAADLGVASWLGGVPSSPLSVA